MKSTASKNMFEKQLDLHPNTGPDWKSFWDLQDSLMLWWFEAGWAANVDAQFPVDSPGWGMATATWQTWSNETMRVINPWWNFTVQVQTGRLCTILSVAILWLWPLCLESIFESHMTHTAYQIMAVLAKTQVCRRTWSTPKLLWEQGCHLQLLGWSDEAPLALHSSCVVFSLRSWLVCQVH